MTPESRAKETLEQIVRGIGDGTVMASDAEALIAQAIRYAENDKLEEAAQSLMNVTTNLNYREIDGRKIFEEVELASLIAAAIEKIRALKKD